MRRLGCDLHAIELIEHLDSLGEKIIWAPNRHIGGYVQKQTGADVLCWQSSCIVHDEFKTQALRKYEGAVPQRGDIGASRVATGGGRTGRCRRINQSTDPSSENLAE